MRTEAWGTDQGGLWEFSITKVGRKKKQEGKKEQCVQGVSGSIERETETGLGTRDMDTEDTTLRVCLVYCKFGLNK